MIEWRVIYSRQAENDLSCIFEYIAYDLFEPGTAERQSNRIIDSITNLDCMPFRYACWQEAPWLNQALHVMPVDNYLVFYQPDESTKLVTIIRIMYGGRDIDAQLVE